MIDHRKRSLGICTLLVVLVACGAGIGTGCSRTGGAAGADAAAGHRIVCLTPSSTEIVAALGATDLIVGVDKYSSYPPEVVHLPKIGDFLSPNLEAILALHPDIAVLDQVQSEVAAKLNSAGITAISMPMQSLDDVRNALVKVGAALGREDAARRAIARLDDDLARVRGEARRRSAKVATRPRVLFVVDRQPGGLGGLVAAGPDTYLDEILGLLGVDNVLARSPVRYSNLSAEQVIVLAPDVILDAAHTEDAVASRADWEALTSVPAVKNGRVYVIADAVLMSPGPRLPEVLERLLPLVWP